MGVEEQRMILKPPSADTPPRQSKRKCLLSVLYLTPVTHRGATAGPTEAQADGRSQHAAIVSCHGLATLNVT